MPLPIPAAGLFTLLPHSQCAAPGHWLVRVHLSGDASGWQLRYQLPASSLRLPAATSPARRSDELWRHTCAELFVAAEQGTGYREFNFAPSGAWAAYDFDDYRCHAATLPDMPAPAIQCTTDDTQVTVTVSLPPAALPECPTGVLRLGLTAVLEADDGTLSYWALHHPTANPDFHHRAGFTLTLA